MGIHQAMMMGYATADTNPTWTLVGSDESSGFFGATISVANCEAGDQAWYGYSVDNSTGIYNPSGYTIIRSSTSNAPDFTLSRRTITSSGTETVSVESVVDNAILMVFRSSTGSIVNKTEGTYLAIDAESTGSSGMPTTPTANTSNRIAPADSIALNVGYLDDDNPTTITAPTGYTFIVAGNTDDGTTSSSLFSAYAETTSSSSSPPGAGNAWTASGQNSDQNVCIVVYLIHGS